LFPGQTYLPITQGLTRNGNPKKYSTQLRINLFDITNCPQTLQANLGVGRGTGIVSRINRSRFVFDIVRRFGFRFGNAQYSDIVRENIPPDFIQDFERGILL
jgi:hypothetical protein